MGARAGWTERGYSLGYMLDFYRTESGKTLRIGRSDDGMLRIHILKDGEWTQAPVGMIGLRVSPSTRRLSRSEIRALPS